MYNTATLLKYRQQSAVTGGTIVLRSSVLSDVCEQGILAGLMGKLREL